MSTEEQLGYSKVSNARCRDSHDEHCIDLINRIILVNRGLGQSGKPQAVSETETEPQDHA